MTMTINQVTQPGRSTTLTRASSQWRTRPDDERMPDMPTFRAKAHEYMSHSKERLVDISSFGVEADGDELLLDGTQFNNWAFGQFCSTVRVPADYLRRIPASLAAENISHGLGQLEPETIRKLLITPSGHLGAFTGEGYARIWNAEIADWLCELQAAQPHWTFPTAFKTAGGGQKAEAWGERKELPVAFLSDRDCFVFLCDYEHPIEVPGAATPLTRGFWVENNEVGAGSVRLTMFLFDFVCSNVLVWGARNVIEVKIAHKGRARERVLFDDSEARQAIAAFANRSARADAQRIVRAQNMLVADTTGEVVSEVFRQRLPGLTKTVLEQAMIIADSTPRYQLGAGPTSVWALVNGLTEISQKQPYAEARIEIDRSASRILDAMVPAD